jgi:hypothetical protein
VIAQWFKFSIDRATRLTKAKSHEKYSGLFFFSPFGTGQSVLNFARQVKFVVSSLGASQSCTAVLSQDIRTVSLLVDCYGVCERTRLVSFLLFWQVIVSRYMGLLCGPLNLAKIFFSLAKKEKKLRYCTACLASRVARVFSLLLGEPVTLVCYPFPL